MFMEKIFEYLVNFFSDYYVGFLSMSLILMVLFVIIFLNIKKIEKKQNKITESWYISDKEHEAYSQVNEKVLFNSPLTFSLSDVDMDKTPSIKLNPYYLNAINNGVSIIEKKDFRIFKI